MPLGNPIRKQNESRVVSVLATEGQTVFTVQGGYIINHISVFRNGVRLSNAEDFTAGDGSTVTLNNAANIDDRIEFHVFDRFTVQNAIVSAASTQTISGDVVVNGKIFGNLDVPQINVASGIVTTHDLNVTGIVTATELDLNGKGDISGDLNVVGVTTFTGLVDANGGAHIDNLRLGIDADNDITTSSGNLTLDSAAGNVVINDNLDVDGTTTLDGVVSIADSIVHTGDTDTSVRFPSADTFTVETAGSEALRITSTGLIRMGNGAEANTEASITAAIFQNTTGAATILKLGNTNTPSSANNRAIEFCDGAGGTEGSSKYTYARIKAERTGGSNAGSLIFYTKPDNSSDATEKLSITSGGIVQIGGAPENSADIDTSNTKLIIKQSGGAQEDGIYMERSGERRGHYIYIGGALDQNDALCVTTNQLGGDTDLLAIDRAGDVIIGAGNLGIHSTSPDRRFTLYQNATTRMNLKSLADSTVGIEFGDPADHNVGFIVYDNTDDSMQFGVNAGERLRISQAGKVRVGSGSPTYELEVQGSGAQHILVGSTNANGATLVLDGDSNGDGGGSDYSYITHNTSGNLVLNADNPSANAVMMFVTGDGNEKMRIDDSGRLLLAATSGTARFHIKGNGGDGIKIENSGGTNAACIDLKNTLSGYNKEYRIAVAGSDGAYGSASSLFVRDQTAGATRLELATSGDLKVNTGDIFFGTAGKGICLGNTANVDANTLDDYEEGDFTPQMHDGNGSNTVLSTISGRNFYIKIGQLCYISGSVTLNDTGKSGQLTMTHLPFSSIDVAQLAVGNWWMDRGSPAAGDIVGGTIYKTANTAAMVFVNPTNGDSNDGGSATEADSRYWQFNQWTNGRPVYFNLTYKTQ